MAPWLAVATVCFGAFMGQLDASVVTLAFPALQRQFGVALAGVQWVSLAYLLALVALLVPVGRCSDRYGRKLVYLYGFVLFTAASAGCGLAPTLGVLVAVRVVQAAGAAMLQAKQPGAGGRERPGRAAAGGPGDAGRRAGAGPGAGPGGGRAAGRLGRVALDLLHQCPGRGGGGGGGLVLAAAHPPSRRPPRRRGCRPG